MDSNIWHRQVRLTRNTKVGQKQTFGNQRPSMKFSLVGCVCVHACVRSEVCARVCVCVLKALQCGGSGVLKVV